MKARLTFAIFTFTALFVSSAQLQANQTVDTWTGGGLTNNWSEPANWSPAGNQPPLSNDYLHFGGSVRPAPVNDFFPNFSVGQIIFNSGAAPFTLSGFSVGFFNINPLPNLIQNNSTSLQTINFANNGGVFGSGIVTQFPTSIVANSGNLLIQSNIEIENFGANATLTFDGSQTTTVTGIIRDAFIAAGITKNGSGTLVLARNNVFSGPVNINNGTVQVDAPFALGQGDTNIIGILPNFAVLETFGPNPFFFFVGNNFTILGGLPFNILQMKVGGLIPGFTSDHMTTGNNANLSGELFVHKINNFMPLVGDQVNIISTGGVVNGTFQSVQSDFPGLVRPIAIYFAQAVDVRFVLSATFLSQALTFNQQQVAHAIDLAFASLCLTPAQRAQLGSIPIAFLPAAFDLIAPEEFGALYEMSFSRAVMQSSNLQHRMDQVRANADPNCGPIVQVNPVEGKDKNMTMPPAPAPAPRFNTFATGSGEYVAVHDQDANAQGYRITNGTFLAGADYSFLNMFAIGVYGGYAGSEAELNNRGQLISDGGQVGGYATFFTHGFYVQGAGGAG